MRMYWLLLVVLLVGCNEAHHSEDDSPFENTPGLNGFKTSFKQLAADDKGTLVREDLPEAANDDFVGVWVAEQKYSLNYMDYDRQHETLIFEKTIFTINKDAAGDYWVSTCNLKEGAQKFSPEELALAVPTDLDLAVLSDSALSDVVRVEPQNNMQMLISPPLKRGEFIKQSSVNVVYARAVKIASAPEINGLVKFSLGEDKNPSMFWSSTERSFTEVPSCVQWRYMADKNIAKDRYANEYRVVVRTPANKVEYYFDEYADVDFDVKDTRLGIYSSDFVNKRYFGSSSAYLEGYIYSLQYSASKSNFAMRLDMGIHLFEVKVAL
jgi:hypothetical protein